MGPDPDRLGRLIGAAVRRIEPVGGGCIAQASRAVTDTGTLFVKSGSAEVALSLDSEADGLRTLARACHEAGPVVPRVEAFEPEQGTLPAVLVLEWIEPVSWTHGHWERLGRDLAALHRVERERFGHHRDNFIGRLPQHNEPLAAWPAFFRERRLAPQVSLARSKGRWRPAWDERLDRLEARLDSLLPERPVASQLHGDLWAGNVMATTGGRAALIDPAVYAGDRETDLAMARLFGGFDRRFFASYDEAWPLSPGWSEREPVYRLYHLINHLNHFGEGYAGGVDRALREAGRS